MMRELEKYVQENFPDELEKVRRDFANEFPKLTDAEKTIVYKYTDDDFTFMGINGALRRSEGLIVPEFAKYLDFALSKLPKSKLITTYRGTNKSRLDFEKLLYAFENRTLWTDYGFFSTSHSRIVADSYGDLIFIILGKRGKAIEKISKFGARNLENEEEVLFNRGTSFKVLSISESRNKTIIKLREY
jgi:hypothetical protein